MSYDHVQYIGKVVQDHIFTLEKKKNQSHNYDTQIRRYWWKPGSHWKKKRFKETSLQPTVMIDNRIPFIQSAGVFSRPLQQNYITDQRNECFRCIAFSAHNFWWEMFNLLAEIINFEQCKIHVILDFKMSNFYNFFIHFFFFEDHGCVLQESISSLFCTNLLLVIVFYFWWLFYL